MAHWFHEIIKAQSFEFSVSDVIPANVKNISPLVLFALFCYFYGWKSFYKVFLYFWPYFTNLWSCEVLNVDLYLNVSDVIHANEHTKHDCGLHVNFWNFLLIPYCFRVRRIILGKSCYFGLRPPLMKNAKSVWYLVLVSFHKSKMFF